MVNSDLCDHSRWLSIRFFPFREVRRNWSTDLTPSIFITGKGGQRIERRLRRGRYCMNTGSVDVSIGDVLYQVFYRRFCERSLSFDRITVRVDAYNLNDVPVRQ